VTSKSMMQSVAECCRALQCVTVAVYDSVLQCLLQCMIVYCSVLNYIAALQCICFHTHGTYGFQRHRDS